MGWYVKKGESSQNMAGMWELFEMQKLALRKQESKEISLRKKYKQHQHFLNFERNLYISKHSKRCNIFLNKKVLKVLT